MPVKGNDAELLSVVLQALYLPESVRVASDVKRLKLRRRLFHYSLVVSIFAAKIRFCVDLAVR